jgi:hypothetical protein
MARKSLDKWIDESIADPMKEKITAIALIHMQGNAQKELYTYQFKVSVSADPKEMADLFNDKAKTYAQDLVGPQTFQLFAFYGTKEPQARHPFVIKPEAELNSGLSTEAATNEGYMQQTMRHKEQAMDAVFQQQQHLNHHVNAMLAQQGDMMSKMGTHISQLQSDNMGAFNVVKDLMMQMVDKEHTRKMELLAYERSTDERKKWLSFAPPLINRLLGQEIFPQNMEDTALIETIADNLTDEHLSMLQILPEAIRGPLAARIESHVQKKNQEKAAMKALPQYQGSAEDDIGGGTH